MKNLQFCWYCLQLGLLILPVIPSLGTVILGLILLLTLLQQYPTIIRRLENRGFALLSVLLILSAVFAFDKREAFLGLFNFLPFFLVFAGFSVLIQTPAQLRKISWILVITSIPVDIFGFGQIFFNWTTPKWWESIFGWAIAAGGNPPGRMASVFMYANILAGYLVIVFVLGLGLWLEAYGGLRSTGDTNSTLSQSLPSGTPRGVELRVDTEWLLQVGVPPTTRLTRARGWTHHLPITQSPNLPFLFLTVVVILNFVALILTNSRNAWIIALVACLAYALYQGWGILVAAVTGVATSVVLAAFAPSPIADWFRKFVPAFFWARFNDQLYPDRPVALMRTTQWEFAWSLTMQRPWTGWGLRNFTPLYEAQKQIWLGHPHNLFLMLSAETGLPTTLVFCGLIAWILIKAVQVLRNSQFLHQADKLIFFSYIVVLGSLILFNAVDVSIFDLRLNILSWFLLSGIAGIVYFQEQQKYSSYRKS
ncbi:MAG: O-antigen ligase family protein [Nostocaceae cyanobacterium]|nr:O-antigen ligase family protein [Nostocaceae cyanobacterium]